MPLYVKAQAVPEKKVVRQGEQGEGWMTIKRAYGNECSLMIAVRFPGYHTTPHAHVSEQINYVLQGEIWFFVEEEAFCCKQGDFQRIPANKIHWAWNRSESEAIVVEAHSPPLVGGALMENSFGLFGESEKPNLKGPGSNDFVPYDYKKVEARYFQK